MALPSPFAKKNHAVVSKRNINNEKITASELDSFMKKHGISEREMSEIFGVTIGAVRLWLNGDRSISVTNSRLVRLFIKYPKLLEEF
jgi:DNA-binding transcriptional regulator YiaG